MLLYSTIVGSYSPLISFLVLPGLYNIVAIMKRVKAPGLGVGDVVSQVFAGMQADQHSPVAVFNSTSSLFVCLISMALIVVFTYSVASLYRTSRPRAVTAVAVSMGVLLPIPMFMIVTFYYTVLYAAL
jgi:hypothetical protein